MCNTACSSSSSSANKLFRRHALCSCAVVQAVADVELKAAKPIQLRDVQQLVLWVFGQTMSPRWVFVKVHSSSS